MIDTVNMFPLWGLPPRCIKLSNAPWEKKFWGLCEQYYTLTLEFELRSDTFDKDLNDIGTKVLNGHWNPLLGKGCTLNLTLSTGVITAATVNAGGTNYPPSTTVRLSVQPPTNPPTPGVGINGAVIANTNSAGAVTSITSIYNGGSGYTLVTAVPTGRVGTPSDANWLIDNIQGMPPNPFNPSHFIAATDRLGNPMKSIQLDGHGKPAQVIVGTGYSFISIIAGNNGRSVQDTTAWIPLITQPDEIPEWLPFLPDTPTGGYQYGELVYLTDPLGPDNLIYVSTINNNYNPVTDPSWVQVGADPPGLTSQGNYDSSTSYNLGDYVVDLTAGQIGNIHIEHYPESDFTLLGIPLVL
jgi:hypothetical protein